MEVAAATDTQNAGSVVFGTPVGDVVAYQPDPQQATWNVFRVTDRRTDAPPAPGAPAALSLQQLYLIGQRTLQPIADDLAGAGQPALRRVGPGLAARRARRTRRRASCSPRAASGGGPDPRRSGAGRGLLDAVAVMDRLRSPGGCPWDAEQTHASLLQYLVEECYELLRRRRARTIGPRCARSSATCCCRCSSTPAWRPRHGDGFTIDDVAA